MHHLESWRNRYGTNDIYPLFLQRLEASGRLSPERLEMVRGIYDLHPLVQRGLIVLVDPQPPVYPVLAELTQWATDSSLLLLRWWSVLFSLGSIYVAYRLGRSIRDEATGAWVAILACVGATTQSYAGIGRPYALTQLVILLAHGHSSPYSREGIAPAASGGLPAGTSSSVDGLGGCGSIGGSGPAAGVAASQQEHRAWRSLRGHWWYALGSLLLLGYMLLQLQNPTVSDQGGMRSAWRVWWCYAVAGPFSHLGSFGEGALHTGAAVFAALTLSGAVWLIRRRRGEANGWLAGGLVASAACGVLAAAVVGVEVRFAVSYIAPALLLAGLGARSIPDFRSGVFDCRAAVALMVLIFFGGLAVFHPEDPYERIDQYDVPWSQVAEALKQELRPGETWVTYPPNLANNVYRYGPLPEPLMPMSEAAYLQAIAPPDTLVLKEAVRADVWPWWAVKQHRFVVTRTRNPDTSHAVEQ